MAGARSRLEALGTVVCCAVNCPRKLSSVFENIHRLFRSSKRENESLNREKAETSHRAVRERRRRSSPSPSQPYVPVPDYTPPRSVFLHRSRTREPPARARSRSLEPPTLCESTVARIAIASTSPPTRALRGCLSPTRVRQERRNHVRLGGQERRASAACGWLPAAPADVHSSRFADGARSPATGGMWEEGSHTATE